MIDGRLRTWMAHLQIPPRKHAPGEPSLQTAWGIDAERRAPVKKRGDVQTVKRKLLT